MVVTVSDGVSAGAREDLSGRLLAESLISAGYEVERSVVPDEQREIVAAIQNASGQFDLVLTTGGTGFGPRDVTPEATAVTLDRQAPGIVHLMMAKGIEVTPYAALSRGTAGTLGPTLVVNLPGSPKGASQSLDALIDLLPHILDLIGGDTEHG